MRGLRLHLAGVALAGMALAAQAGAQTPAAVPAAPAAAVKPTGAPSPQDILDKAPATIWKDVPAEDLVVMKLADGTTVDMQLAPVFAPVHSQNVRQLVRTGYFDGASILRVQDNYVVQWGRPDEDTTKPQGIVANPPAEYERSNKGLKLKRLPYRDAYASIVGHVQSWPVASDGKSDWLVHCYGMVGVARNNPPDTGNSTQLYAIIGHAPRHLDRNLTVVGRILAGMDILADRPRGTEELGFYKTDAERVKIVSARMASDLAPADRPGLQVLDSDSKTFDAWLHAKANRDQAFFVRPAGALDLCNAMPPVRVKP